MSHHAAIAIPILSPSALAVLRHLNRHGRRLVLTEDGPLAGMERELFDLAMLELIGCGVAHIERGLMVRLLVVNTARSC